MRLALLYLLSLAKQYTLLLYSHLEVMRSNSHAPSTASYNSRDKISSHLPAAVFDANPSTLFAVNTAYSMPLGQLEDVGQRRPKGQKNELTSA